jgi:hypothetical protein
MRAFAVIVLTGLTLAACGERAESAAATSMEAVATMQEALPALPEHYWDARKNLFAAGFTPVRPETADFDPFEVCVAETEGANVAPGECEEEVALPEVWNCAGTGRGWCEMVWLSPGGKRLRVVTAGEPQPNAITSVEWLPADALVGGP